MYPNTCTVSARWRRPESGAVTPVVVTCAFAGFTGCGACVAFEDDAVTRPAAGCLPPLGLAGIPGGGWAAELLGLIPRGLATAGGRECGESL
jgi:hypothetical protein